MMTAFKTSNYVYSDKTCARLTLGLAQSDCSNRMNLTSEMGKEKSVKFVDTSEQF